MQMKKHIRQKTIKELIHENPEKFGHISPDFVEMLDKKITPEPNEKDEDLETRLEKELRRIKSELTPKD
jgi:hypothetical protein